MITDAQRASIKIVRDLSQELGHIGLADRLGSFDTHVNRYADQLAAEARQEAERKAAEVEARRHAALSDACEALDIHAEIQLDAEAAWDYLKAFNPDLDGVDSFSELTDRLKLRYFILTLGVNDPRRPDAIDFTKVHEDLRPKSAAAQINQPSYDYGWDD